MDAFFIPEDAEEQLEERGFFVARNLIGDQAIEAVNHPRLKPVGLSLPHDSPGG